MGSGLAEHWPRAGQVALIRKQLWDISEKSVMRAAGLSSAHRGGNCKGWAQAPESPVTPGIPKPQEDGAGWDVPYHPLSVYLGVAGWGPPTMQGWREDSVRTRCCQAPRQGQGPSHAGDGDAWQNTPPFHYGQEPS